MNTSGVKSRMSLINEVWFSEDMLHVRLLDGREVSVPIEWFPLLSKATDKERANWRLIGNGIGIHWEDIDEDISLAGLLTI